MSIKVDFEYNGRTYMQFTQSEAANIGVPLEVFEAALNKLYWRSLRNFRNKLIEDSDWTVLSDAPLDTSKKAAWKTYRDALRDFPETLKSQNIAPDVALNDPSVWPQKPQ